MLVCTNLIIADLCHVNVYRHIPLILGEPDAQLNPKKKVWETVKPDMRVDASNFATYKGAHWKLKNNPSAIIKSPSIVNAQIS